MGTREATNDWLSGIAGENHAAAINRKVPVSWPPSRNAIGGGGKVARVQRVASRDRVELEMIPAKQRPPAPVLDRFRPPNQLVPPVVLHPCDRIAANGVGVK